MHYKKKIKEVPQVEITAERNLDLRVRKKSEPVGLTKKWANIRAY